MLRIFLRQFFKIQIHRVFVILIIFPDIHLVQHIDQRGEVLLLRWKLIMDIAYKGNIQKRLRFDPEVFAGLAFSFGIGDKHGNELQDILLTMDIGERIVVHRFAKVDGVESTHLISGCHQQFSCFNDQGSFRVSDHDGSAFRFRALHDVRLDEETCFTRT